MDDNLGQFVDKLINHVKFKSSETLWRTIKELSTDERRQGNSKLMNTEESSRSFLLTTDNNEKSPITGKYGKLEGNWWKLEENWKKTRYRV